MKFVENRCFITLWTDLTDHFGLADNKPDEKNNSVKICSVLKEPNRDQNNRDNGLANTQKTWATEYNPKNVVYLINNYRPSNGSGYNIQKDYMLMKYDSYSHQGCLYLFKNTGKTVILW